MTATVDVLAVLRDYRELRVQTQGAVMNEHDGSLARIDAATDAVAELIETGRSAEVSFNTVRYCYTRAPGNFAIAMSELDSDIAPFRAALARVGAK